ncbi:hypothetical protein TSAR_006719 [Trichomalopsis sarcophagae]|uniref:Uncharacterized protein n=1 Tax=Trichomalopsis sarcophagae TaxID=543379 RepID=A0A232EN54_9HYME|nr:hypothetical protein TSAR_006719 [Trichomalopsis sarcophagae]
MQEGGYTIIADTSEESIKKGTAKEHDPYGQWNDVVVQGHVEILLTNYYATVNPLPDDTCGGKKDTILYEGYTNKRNKKRSDCVTYILETQILTFSLTSIVDLKVYGHNLLRTEHPKLFILENPSVQAPDAFAFRLMKEPGYMTVTEGEVVHLIKCLQVEVQRRDIRQCYQLPVFRGTRPLFLSPRTRILTKTDTQISCSGAMPPMFNVGLN